MIKIEIFIVLQINKMSNQLIIDLFDQLISQKSKELLTLQKNQGDPGEIKKLRFKKINLKRVRDIIAEYKPKINSGNDLKDIKFVGKGAIERIDEILKTGKLSEINEEDNLDRHKMTVKNF